MKQLLDIVNFNADASCLSSEDWLVALKGGGDSLFCKWLNLFVKNNKKVILGLTGATVADLYYFNNEAIEIINTYPKIFEIIFRSFSHDVSLLRSSKGFKENFLKGHEIISNEFKNVIVCWLRLGRVSIENAIRERMINDCINISNRSPIVVSCDSIIFFNCFTILSIFGNSDCR